jgi:homospermidine synthase
VDVGQPEQRRPAARRPPHEEILEIARPYLGPVVSESVDWSPLDDWQEPFPGARPSPAAADAWQFGTFLVRGPQG